MLDIRDIDFIGLTDAIGIPLCVVGLALLVWVWISDKLKASNKKRMPSVKKAKRGSKKVNGMIFGASLKDKNLLYYSPTKSEGFCGVFSATGTGKSTAVGIPTLRAWLGHFFCIDIAGDLLKNCINFVKRFLVFNPEGTDGNPFNIFGHIDRLTLKEEKIQALAQLAILIMPEDVAINSNANARFFYRGGRNILSACLTAFYLIGLDFCEICIKIISTPWKELFREIEQLGCAEAVAYLSGFDPDRPQDIAGSMQDCVDAVSLFATNVNVRRWVRRPNEGETAIEPCSIENYSIFVVLADSLLDLYSPLLNIIVSLQMQYIGDRVVTDKSKMILLYLDEYVSLKLSAQTVLSCLRRYRKRLCRVMILTQAYCDFLTIGYTDAETRAILSNLKFKVLLGGLEETDSRKYFADLIGYKDTKKYSHSRSSRATTTTDTEVREYKIEPADLDRQGKDIAILIISEGDGFIRLRKNYFWKYDK